MTITVTHQPFKVYRGSIGCYHAQIAPGKWEAGATPDEAIGKLVVSYPREFNVEEINR